MGTKPEPFGGVSTDSLVQMGLRASAFPPSPPATDAGLSDKCSDDEQSDFPLPPSTSPPSEILDIDKATPDSHVPRDPRLIRLTGVHPLNVEAPLSALFNEGFLTSPELFYVRNHAHVPEVREDDIPSWEFSVEGLVEEPFTITLSKMIDDYEQITYPVTLVCAGNRRKEQNMVRKTKGFSWGAAGVSTALFTGVAMSDLIRNAKPKKGARYLCMEGADDLPNGKYATSVKLNWVMDPNRGILVSYKMNGEMLRPDHGKPLRAVIPGQIGGRSVKWLKRLIVTDVPSDNWYHIYDNRVLPTTVSPEESAKDPKWWMDERYAIYDLNPNSAICYPAHGETLALSDDLQTYRARGYAYSGGGRRITRVELSLDQGASWRLADIEYPEDRYREVEKDLFGGRLDMSWRETCFCWCHWSFNLPVEDLRGAHDIVLRSMDESMNVQPRDMYWSVLGMMNNPWFRVKIFNEGDKLRFDHPTQPALLPGGWMEDVKKSGGNLTNGFWGERLGGEDANPTTSQVSEEVSMVKAGLKNPITLEELRKHEDKAEPWFVVDGEVYDGTKFLDGHPGGATSIIAMAGLDGTDEFMAIRQYTRLAHLYSVTNEKTDSETAKAMMPDYHIGSLDDNAKKMLADTADAAAVSDKSEPRATFLQARIWSEASLHSKRMLSWDTRILTFQLDQPEQRLGLPVGQHLMVRLEDSKTHETLIRSYTPVSEIDSQGFMDMLVKVYFDKEGVTGGKMSQALEALPIGGRVTMKGPIGKFEYLGRGCCAIQGANKTYTRFIMICGGSGITPIYQVFRSVMRDPEDNTQCLILNGNRQYEDILCKDELDCLAKGNEHKCNIIHTLTRPNEEWQGRCGRIDADLVKQNCQHDEETLVLICGPEALEKSMHRIFLELGWPEEQLLFF